MGVSLSSDFSAKPDRAKKLSQLLVFPEGPLKYHGGFEKNNHFFLTLNAPITSETDLVNFSKSLSNLPHKEPIAFTFIIKIDEKLSNSIPIHLIVERGYVIKKIDNKNQVFIISPQVHFQKGAPKTPIENVSCHLIPNVSVTENITISLNVETFPENASWLVFDTTKMQFTQARAIEQIQILPSVLPVFMNFPPFAGYKIPYQYENVLNLTSPLEPKLQYILVHEWENLANTYKLLKSIQSCINLKCYIYVSSVKYDSIKSDIAFLVNNIPKVGFFKHDQSIGKSGVIVFPKQKQTKMGKCMQMPLIAQFLVSFCNKEKPNTRQMGIFFLHNDITIQSHVTTTYYQFQEMNATTIFKPSSTAPLAIYSWIAFHQLGLQLTPVNETGEELCIVVRSNDFFLIHNLIRLLGQFHTRFKKNNFYIVTEDAKLIQSIKEVVDKDVTLSMQTRDKYICVSLTSNLNLDNKIHISATENQIAEMSEKFPVIVNLAKQTLSIQPVSYIQGFPNALPFRPTTLYNFNTRDFMYIVARELKSFQYHFQKLNVPENDILFTFIRNARNTHVGDAISMLTTTYQPICIFHNITWEDFVKSNDKYFENILRKYKYTTHSLPQYNKFGKFLVLTPTKYECNITKYMEFKFNDEQDIGGVAVDFIQNLNDSKDSHKFVADLTFALTPYDQKMMAQQNLVYNDRFQLYKNQLVIISNNINMKFFPKYQIISRDSCTWQLIQKLNIEVNPEFINEYSALRQTQCLSYMRRFDLTYIQELAKRFLKVIKELNKYQLVFVFLINTKNTETNKPVLKTVQDLCVQYHAEYNIQILSTNVCHYLIMFEKSVPIDIKNFNTYLQFAFNQSTFIALLDDWRHVKELEKAKQISKFDFILSAKQYKQLAGEENVLTKEPVYVHLKSNLILSTLIPLKGLDGFSCISENVNEREIERRNHIKQFVKILDKEFYTFGLIHSTDVQHMSLFLDFITARLLTRNTWYIVIVKLINKSDFYYYDLENIIKTYLINARDKTQNIDEQSTMSVLYLQQHDCLVLTNHLKNYSDNHIELVYSQYLEQSFVIHLHTTGDKVYNSEHEWTLNVNNLTFINAKQNYYHYYSHSLAFINNNKHPYNQIQSFYIYQRKSLKPIDVLFLNPRLNWNPLTFQYIFINGVSKFDFEIIVNFLSKPPQVQYQLRNKIFIFSNVAFSDEDTELQATLNKLNFQKLNKCYILYSNSDETKFSITNVDEIIHIDDLHTIQMMDGQDVWDEDSQVANVIIQFDQFQLKNYKINFAHHNLYSVVEKEAFYDVKRLHPVLKNFQDKYPNNMLLIDSLEFNREIINFSFDITKKLPLTFVPAPLTEIERRDINFYLNECKKPAQDLVDLYNLTTAKNSIPARFLHVNITDINFFRFRRQLDHFEWNIKRMESVNDSLKILFISWQENYEPPLVLFFMKIYMSKIKNLLLLVGCHKKVTHLPATLNIRAKGLIENNEKIHLHFQLLDLTTTAPLNVEYPYYYFDLVTRDSATQYSVKVLAKSADIGYENSYLELRYAINNDKFFTPLRLNKSIYTSSPLDIFRTTDGKLMQADRVESLQKGVIKFYSHEKNNPFAIFALSFYVPKESEFIGDVRYKLTLLNPSLVNPAN